MEPSMHVNHITRRFVHVQYNDEIIRVNVPNNVNRFKFDELNWNMRVVVERNVYKDFFYEFAQIDIDALFDGEESRKRKIERKARKMYANFLHEFELIDGLFDETDNNGTASEFCIFSTKDIKV